jgi:hypothetical protein
MDDEPLRPAWSEAFHPEELSSIAINGPLAKITASGMGKQHRTACVAIVDNGIRRNIRRWRIGKAVAVEYDEL